MNKVFEMLKKAIFLIIGFLAVFMCLLAINTLLNFKVAETTLKYLEVLVWPTVVLLIVLFFQEELRHLIRNVSALRGPGGIEATISQPEPSKETPEISEELKRDGVAELRSMDVDKSELINRLVSLQVALHFERTYNFIFGSQIRLLESLERLGFSGQTYENIAAIYQSERATHAVFHSYPLRDYLGFLENAGLVGIVSETGRRLVKITPMGIDFLEYMRAMRYPVKP